MQPNLKTCPNCKMNAVPETEVCPRCNFVYPKTRAYVPLAHSSTVADRNPYKIDPFKIIIAIALAVFLIVLIQLNTYLNPHKTLAYAELKGRLHTGMTISDVQESIGRPDRTQDIDNNFAHMQFFYYTSKEGEVQVEFINGRVFGIMRL